MKEHSRTFCILICNYLSRACKDIRVLILLDQALHFQRGQRGHVLFSGQFRFKDYFYILEGCFS